MNRIKAILLAALLALGCAGATEEPSQLDESPDIGALGQPLVNLPNGYGVMTNQDRCFTGPGQTTWPGGKCYVPFLRTANVVENTGSCGGAYSADLRAGMLVASEYLRGQLSGAGWTVYRNNPIPDRQHPAVVIELTCGSVFAGSNANSLGGTSFIEGGCSSTSAGQLCQYSQINSRLYTSRFEAIPAMATWTSAQRKTGARDILAHEGGHGAGLGHDLCGQSPLADLMGNFACQNWGAPSTMYGAVFRNVERQWLTDYRPF